MKNLRSYLEKQEELIKKYKMSLLKIESGKSIHAPFWDLNIGTKMKLIRQETMNMFNNAYDKAKELGCTEIIVHNGYIPGTYLEEGWLKRAKEFWQEFFENKDNTITMCIENQFEKNSEIMTKEIDLVNDERLKICLDIGHANANSNMKVEEWIKTLGTKIGYVHLHNNHGKQNKKGINDDEHLGLDNGTIDMKQIFEILEKYTSNAIWAIETHTKYIEESLRYLHLSVNRCEV